MPDLALRGIPADVHQALREAAQRNHRSLNGEILRRLEVSVHPMAEDVDALLARIGERGGRSRLGSLDDAALRTLKDEGRP